MSHLTPDELLKNNPAVYRSSIVHHGGIREAFEKIGIKYEFPENYNWRAKVIPFLGELPDKDIAEIVDVTVHQIRSLRKKHGVERFRKNETNVD